MEKDKDEANKGKKGRVKPTDPRLASERYALNETVRKIKEAQKIIENAPPISHTVSDVDPYATKKPKVEKDCPSSNPNNAIISSSPIPQQPPRTTSASTTRNNVTADGTLFANNSLDTLMQRMEATESPMPDTVIPVTPVIVQPNSMGNVVAGIPVIPQGNMPPALNARSSIPTIRNDSDVDIQALIDMCHPIRRERNGNARRSFKIPLEDYFFCTDPNLLNETFRSFYV
uniref:Uncharacterized protein n=1 Tax=Panagrolaimus sp. PS1159 TaxID=55785 RepID=A0AC35F3D1_9BILA